MNSGPVGDVAALNADNDAPMEQISNSQLQDSRQQWPALMGRAMELAARVLSAHPNPRVGCVLEKQGRIIAEGWHEAPGLPHAEAMALAMAGEQAAQATVFVTLEPGAGGYPGMAIVRFRGSGKGAQSWLFQAP